MPFTVYIAMQNIEADNAKLSFNSFSINKINSQNYSYYKDLFTTGIYRSGQYVLEIYFAQKPQIKQGMDISGLGNIPNESEDLMFLLRLFRRGDIVFIKQVIKDDNDKIWSQYKYPSVYSDYHSPRHYKMFTTDIPVFNLFTAQALGTQGWNAPWLDIARKFFLWGVSKEFFPGRDNERILDYMIALESLLVIDNDFISKQIRERAAALHPITGIKELINKFYAFRSIIAHGSKLNSKAIDYINKNMDNFEDIVRCLLLKAITLCPSDEDKRNVFLLSLYKITDKDRAEKIIADYKKIKLSKIQHAIRSELGTTRGRPE